MTKKSGTFKTNLLFFNACYIFLSVSPKWNGTGWYRMMEPAGTKIPEFVPSIYSCGTDAPGWLIGNHPITPGETLDLTICFNWSSQTCRTSRPIKVKNCGDFFLYFLENTDSCNYRYCAE